MVSGLEWKHIHPLLRKQEEQGGGWINEVLLSSPSRLGEGVARRGHSATVGKEDDLGDLAVALQAYVWIFF